MNKSGDTEMDASSQVTLDTRKFEWVQIETCGKLNETVPRVVIVCQELLRTSKRKQCIMSSVVTNRGRQRFRVAVDGESLSDDLKKNSQGRNPRIREVPTAGKRAVPTAGKYVNLIGVRDKAAIRSFGDLCGEQAHAKKMRS